MAIRIGVLAVLLYWSFVLVRPFVSIAIWSVVLTVALYPAFEWTAGRLGGRRRLAAVLITIVSLLVAMGPVIWLVLGITDSVRLIVERLDPSTLSVPMPPTTVRDWPLIGEPIYEFWELAATNFKTALAKIAPHLKPLGSSVLHAAADVGIGTVKFLVAIVVAGFLFPVGPSLMAAAQMIGRKLDA